MRKQNFTGKSCGYAFVVMLMAILPVDAESQAGLDLMLREARFERGLIAIEIDVRNPYGISREGVLLRVYCTSEGEQRQNLHLIATSSRGRAEAEQVRMRVPVDQEIDLPGGIPAGGRARLSFQVKTPVEDRNGMCSRVELRGTW